MPVRQRTPRGLPHFQCPRDAGPVARLQAPGGTRIAPRQFRMQRLDAVPFQPRTHALAYRLRNRRHRGETPRQRLEVEAGTTDEDRQQAPLTRFAQRPRGIDDPGAG
jgi:hypothetical protein